MQPTAPTRPVPRNLSETPQQPAVTDAEPNPLPQIEVPEKIAAEKPERIVSSRPKPEKPQKPQLVAPPARPTAEEPQELEPLTQADKPILKRERPQRVEEEREQIKPRVAKLPTDQAAQAVPAPQRQARPTPSPMKPEQRGSRPSAPAPSFGDPQRPRPVRPGEAVAAMPIATPPRPMQGAPGKQRELRMQYQATSLI